jgi:LemA protein
MSTGTLLLIAAGVLLLGLIFFLITIYNQLIRGRIRVQEGLSTVGACLQQRNDLIPNLVETVKGYAGHENKTLTEVVKWRNQSAAATSVEEQNTATKGLNQAMLNMMAITEAYPDLKADTHFRELMSQLAETENKINDARRYYNGTVRNYNEDAAVFPKPVWF